MATVKIIAGNLFAGIKLQKLEAGSVVEVDDATAARWVERGLAEDTKEKGAALFEVATPSVDDATAETADAADAPAETTKKKA